MIFNIEILAFISLIVVSIYLLVRSADLIEESFVYISKKLKVSEFFMGFVVLATVSSLPELAIAFNSSREIPELSVGNLLGATLIMLTLVIGLSAIRFKNVHFKGRYGTRELFIGLLLTIFNIGALLDRQLTVFEGIILVGVYVSFAVYIFYKFRKKKPEEENQTVPARKMYSLLVKTLIGIIVLLFASTAAVNAVIRLGDLVSINESLIGLFVLAIGTNTPELALLLRAENFDQTKLAIGNFIGSAVFNTMTLGILSIMSGGVQLSVSNYVSLLPVMALIVFACILFLIFGITGKELTRTEGILLIAIYVSLLVSEGILLFQSGITL